MKKLSAAIIIIDDDERMQKDPFLSEARDVFEQVLFYSDSNDGIRFIESNIGLKMVVLLDLGFTKNMLDGHAVLKKIRTLSTLIPVIIWSARDEDKESFADLIENRAFAFMKKSCSCEELMDVVMRAYSSMENDLSGSIEAWINEHPQDAMDKPFLTSSDGKSYTMGEILREIRLQTPIGIEVAKNINKLTIDLLMRNKERLQ